MLGSPAGGPARLSKNGGTVPPQHGRILFYSTRGEYGCFSNYAPYPIHLKGRIWPTSEHYFQAQKFADTEREEAIRLARSAQEASRLGRSRQYPVRFDREQVKDEVMHEAVLTKFTQHDDLRAVLEVDPVVQTKNARSLPTP